MEDLSIATIKKAGTFIPAFQYFSLTELVNHNYTVYEIGDTKFWHFIKLTFTISTKG